MTAHAVHYSSATGEWYTPKPIIDRVVRFFGTIDLDPCSNSHDVPNVPAARHYTQDDNGLMLPWMGNVYCNPEYGRNIKPWIAKLVSEYESGNISAAIALVPARVDTAWFKLLWPHTICFIHGRLTFVGGESGAPFPSALVYLGLRPSMFYRAFSDIGTVVRRMVVN